MKFLLAANMPRSVASLLRGLGYQVEDVREVLPRVADDATVVALAQSGQLIFVTRDFGFADIRNYPPANYSGLVVLQLPHDAPATQVNKVLESFVGDPRLLGKLSGKLAIVETWRVRFRSA